MTRAPNREKASCRIKKASGHVKEASCPDQKALGQDEDLDLVQRRASQIKEYLLIDPTLKVDTNVVDQVEIIVNNDVVNDLNSNTDIPDTDTIVY